MCAALLRANWKQYRRACRKAQREAPEARREAGGEGAGEPQQRGAQRRHDRHEQQRPPLAHRPARQEEVDAQQRLRDSHGCGYSEYSFKAVSETSLSRMSGCSLC